MAGIDDHQISLFRHIGSVKIQGRQNIRHTLGVIDVHLAAKSFDIKFFRQPRAVAQLHADSLA